MRLKFNLGILTILLLSISPSAYAGVHKGEAAPTFKVPSTSGQNLVLANYRGNVVLLDFFASWCTPCQTSIPHLLNLKRKYGKQGLQIIGMSIDEDPEEIRSFILTKKITYPVAMINETLQADYGLRSIPTMYVINKNGIIAERYMGFNDSISQSVETLVKKLLAEK